MNEDDSKLCKICLNSNTKMWLFDDPSLNRFFSHVLRIQGPPLRKWFCVWCRSTLEKIMSMVQLAEESHSILSRVKLIKQEIKNNNLSLHHNEHTDIPPSLGKDKGTELISNNHTDILSSPVKDTRKILKSNKPTIPQSPVKHVKKLKTQKKSKKLVNKKAKEKQKFKIETKVKEEKIDSENEMDELKVEAMDVEMPDEMDENVESDKDDTIVEKPKKKVNPRLYEKCKQYNFTLKVLTLEEQKAELEEKKKLYKYLKRKYKCEFCGIAFVTEDVYKEHNKRHEEGHSRHECQICHLRFSTSLVLSQHLLAHERRFTCSLCGAVCHRLSDCESHRRMCGQATPGVCQLCSKIFSNQNSLENHIRGVHYKKEKKYVCSYCNQKFPTKQRHAVHTRTHTGLKPYSCEVCHRSFASNSNLRYHLAAHAQARPYYCVECDKSYKTRKGLRRHLLEGASHARSQHSCHHCLKNFSTEVLLATHISSAHTKEADSCSL